MTDQCEQVRLTGLAFHLQAVCHFTVLGLLVLKMSIAKLIHLSVVTKEVALNVLVPFNEL